VSFVIRALVATSLTLSSGIPACFAGDARPVAQPEQGARPGAPPPDGPWGHIRHVVLIVQENRTTDNLFHGLPGADTANSGFDSQGHLIQLQPVDLVSAYDLGHSHADFVAEYDNGRMDGADKVRVSCPGKGVGCAPQNPAFKYVNPSEVQPYFNLAEQYTFGDRMFQSNQGPSYPAHQYLIAGTSRPSEGGQYSDYLVAENPQNPGRPTGCVDSPGSETVQLIDPQGSEDTSIYPCFEHQTLIDLLDEARHTWNYYTPNSRGIWAGPNSIEHLRTGSDWSHVIVPQTQVLTDIDEGRLPDVSWVIPATADSDHPKGNKGTGPSWVASIVNAIGNSHYWSDTAIFIVWDDWGGWFDHVAPPIHSSYESGLRVPLVVVSPYAKRGYVSHVTHDFGSILRFIEEAYGLGSLGYEDARSDDLSDCFEFGRAPAAFKPIAARFDAAYFKRKAATQPDEGPDDD
jgi:phospholipase C